MLLLAGSFTFVTFSIGPFHPEYPKYVWPRSRNYRKRQARPCQKTTRRCRLATMRYRAGFAGCPMGPHWRDHRYSGRCFIGSLCRNTIRNSAVADHLPTHLCGQLSVTVDGEPIYIVNLITSKRRMGILPRSASGLETFSKVITVSAGRHMVQVHISAPGEGFDQARIAAADFTPDRASIMQINATRRNTMAVSLDGAPWSAPPPPVNLAQLPKALLPFCSVFRGPCFQPASVFWCRSSGGRTKTACPFPVSCHYYDAVKRWPSTGMRGSFSVYRLSPSGLGKPAGGALFPADTL